MPAPAPWSPSFEPFFLIVAAGAGLVYLRDLRRTPPRRRPPAWRRWFFCAGLLLIALPVNSPLETLAAHYLLIFHLLQNAMVADWGPPLVILALTVEQRRRIGRWGGRPLAWITNPPVALVLWLAAWYGVHLAPFYDWALRAGWALNLEHTILIFAGFVFWWPCFGEPRRLRPFGVAGYLGIAFAASPWLSLAYIFSTSAFYGFYEEAPRLFGLSAVKDQNLAGILMNAEQTVVFFVAMAWQLLHILAEEERNQRLLDVRSGHPSMEMTSEGGTRG
jgi:putative membrane protein